MRLKLAASGLLIVGCAEPAPPDFHGEEPVAEISEALTVAEAVSGGCSTTAVWGLSLQIIDQMNCLIPGGALVEVPARPNFTKGNATLAFMQPPAVTAFVAALDEASSTTLTANSMLRTLAQQYLLYAWYRAGTCNISLAATPGTSNHESGLAIDVSQYSAWRPTLEAHGFSWLGSSDAVHFDYEGAGRVDLSGKGTLAFQKLWNLNNPSDLLVEDGAYGPQTETRLQRSPTDGFAKPPTCGSGGTGGTAGTGGAGGASSGGSSGAGVGGTGGGTGAAPGTGGSPGVGGSGVGAGGSGNPSGGASGALGSAGAGSNVCGPGQVVNCACPGGALGMQYCTEDGSRLSACMGCPAAAADQEAGCACSMSDRKVGGALAMLAAALLGVATRRRVRPRARTPDRRAVTAAK